MNGVRLWRAAGIVLASITTTGIAVAIPTAPSASIGASPPDESIAFGDVYHLNRCVASRGEDEAIIQVKGKYGWLAVGSGPFVHDEDCAAENPKTPYSAPTVTWEPTSTGTFALRLQYGYNVPDIVSEPWAVRVTPGDPSELTRIRYRVKGCERCQIEPYRYSRSIFLEYPAVTVKNGKAESLVPRRRTQGMAFAVNARRWNPFSNTPFLVTRYAGTSPGTKVTLGKALKARKGTHCWAGTQKRTATVKIHAQRVRIKPNPENYHDDGGSIFLWASPALSDYRSYRNMKPLDQHGIYQHGIYFNGSPSC